MRYSARTNPLTPCFLKTNSGAHYVLGVKGNQPGLAEAVKLWFDAADAGTPDRPFWQDSQTEKDHGRIETRRCVMTAAGARAALGRIAKSGDGGVDAGNHREKQRGNEQYRTPILHQQLARQGDFTGQYGACAPGIENSMHWVLDVAFREDDCRIHCSHGAHNFAVLRRITLNLLKGDAKSKFGIANKRLKAGWDVTYLSKLLGLQK